MKIFIIGDYNLPTIISRFREKLQQIPGIEIVEPVSDPTSDEGHKATIDQCQGVFVLNEYTRNPISRLDFLHAIKTKRKDVYMESNQGMRELEVYTELGII